MKSTAFADERGAGLVEILVSVAIIAIVLTIFLSGLSTATFGVATVRERVTAENLARSQLECIKDHPYVTGAMPISYTIVCAVIAPSSYAIDVSISYWVSPTFTSDPLDDKGMQWITVTICHVTAYRDCDEPVFTIEEYKVDR